MKSLRINIDIDNTVNNFLSEFLVLCNGMRTENSKFEMSDIREYFLDSCTGIDGTVLDTLFFKNPCFYRKLKPLPDSCYVINSLNERHNIKFVTAIDYDVIDSRIEFLRTYFPNINVNKQLIVTNDKHSIFADVVIDDYWDNMSNVNSDCKYLLFSQPWNMGNWDPRVIRVDTWQQIQSEIIKMEYGCE